MGNLLWYFSTIKLIYIQKYNYGSVNLGFLGCFCCSHQWQNTVITAHNICRVTQWHGQSQQMLCYGILRFVWCHLSGANESETWLRISLALAPRCWKIILAETWTCRSLLGPNAAWMAVICKAAAPVRENFVKIKSVIYDSWLRTVNMTNVR